MTFYVVHDAEGNILRTGNCQRHMLERQARPGETAIEGRADQRIDRVLDGQVMSTAAAEALLAERAELSIDR